MLFVKPKARLSLQSHNFRSEHWVVVEGQASVVVGEQKHLLATDESIYIKKTARHRLGNETDKPLFVVEVQTGSYLEEDDILRYQDDYSRDSR